MSKLSVNSPVAIIYNNTVFPENFDIFDCDSSKGTILIKRALKGFTKKDYLVIQVNPDGSFYTSDYIATKIANLIKGLLIKGNTHVSSKL